MGIDRLEKAVTDLEQRMELLEEVLALVVYREEEAKKAEAEMIRKLKEQQAAANAAIAAQVQAARSFTPNFNTKEGE